MKDTVDNDDDATLAANFLTVRHRIFLHTSETVEGYSSAISSTNTQKKSSIHQQRNCTRQKTGEIEKSNGLKIFPQPNPWPLQAKCQKQHAPPRFDRNATHTSSISTSDGSCKGGA